MQQPKDKNEIPAPKKNFRDSQPVETMEKRPFSQQGCRAPDLPEVLQTGWLGKASLGSGLLHMVRS
jgi:hypothetical protein